MRCIAVYTGFFVPNVTPEQGITKAHLHRIRYGTQGIQTRSVQVIVDTIDTSDGVDGIIMVGRTRLDDCIVVPE